MLYRGMDRATLDAAYNNMAAVGQVQRDAYVAAWTTRSQVIRDAPSARLDLRYGVGSRQRLDVFPCGFPASPTLIYIHGGYWQMNDKEPYAFLGEGGWVLASTSSSSSTRSRRRRAWIRSSAKS